MEFGTQILFPLVLGSRFSGGVYVRVIRKLIIIFWGGGGGGVDLESSGHSLAVGANGSLEDVC